MKRKDNELILSAAVLQDLFQAGSTHAYNVEDGPLRGNFITDIRTVDSGGDAPRFVIITYERAINEVVAKNTFGSIVFRSTAEIVVSEVEEPTG